VLRKTLLFIVNDCDFFVSHRLPLAQAAMKDGYSVFLASPASPNAERLKSLGVRCIEITMNRGSTSVLRELVTLFSIFVAFLRVRPRIVHLVTIKPVLYGGLIARLFPVKGVVMAISGLGHVFMAEGRRSVVRRVVETVYRIALAPEKVRVIFQNKDDQQLVSRITGLEESRAVLIPGSGVALDEYHLVPEAQGELRVCFASRLLHDKGFSEFCEAARRIRENGIAARFLVAGKLDRYNPAAVTKAELDAVVASGAVEYVGFRTDMADFLSSCHVVVLPSYREGLPKVLVEAAAVGRAVVTTDVPGCRDAVTPGVTSLVVPVRDAAALADAITRLLLDSELRQKMGAAGRVLAEQRFDIKQVVATHLRIYKEAAGL